MGARVRISCRHKVALEVAAVVVLALAAPHTWSATGEEVQTRISADVEAGHPIVVHVVVALCDNENQAIAPVPSQLGNGQETGTNLYWGALYGLRTHFTRSAGWEKIAAPRIADERILERIVLFATIERDGAEVPVYVVADAWNGLHIKPAIQRFLTLASGGGREIVQVGNGATPISLRAGGSAHLVAYVGHNGLMEFSLVSPTVEDPAETPRASLVLACASKDYFLDHLGAGQSHALLLTTGLMAPEAYTLDAAIRAWSAGGATGAVVDAAAGAYDRYQKCGARAARRLFWGSP